MVMESRQNSALVNAILMFILTWVTVSLRVYVRGFLKKAWGKDDSFMVAALVGPTHPQTLRGDSIC